MTDNRRHNAALAPIPVKRIDYIELYVGNVYQAAHFYRTAYGFTQVAFSGLETGNRNAASVVLEQDDIRLVLTGPLGADSDIAARIKLRGDAVKDIAFEVDDVALAFEAAVKRGARPVMEPTVLEDERGRVVKSVVGAFGDTVHSLIQRDGKATGFLPGYQASGSTTTNNNADLESIDHVAICVDKGSLDEWTDFYKTVFGFFQSHQEDVWTDYSAMNSKVVQNETGSVKFPILEPAEGKRKSQIEEHLSFNGGPGVQHIAFSSSNIVRSVETLRRGGTQFLTAPKTYYEMLERRIGRIDEGIESLQKENILVDRDEWGYLMQIFTRPVHTRPTLFLEIIQRKRARGFGGGNIRALFQAVEQEQLLRGTL